MSPTPLEAWEAEFASAIRSIEAPWRNRAGAILPIIPTRARWLDFLTSVSAEWDDWKRGLHKYPSSLIVLYGGLAFFRYEANTFWPYFAEAVTGRTGSDCPPPNQQTQVNHSFRKALEHHQLRIVSHKDWIDFVGSAVWHIGVPLSLWDGFIEVCEWASWRSDWKCLTQAEWAHAIERRVGTRPRLKQFLTDNRDSATSFIQDILDVREILRSEPDSTIDEIRQASILRQEYFEEVPETAEFIRPKNPDSLFKDRARIVWSEEGRRISVQLPGVKREHLPAMWRIGSRQQPATSTPTELILNSEAFQTQLSLIRESREGRETQYLLGAHPWGLFDLEAGGRLINSNRHEVPLKSYALVSSQKLAISSIEGFDQTESPPNEAFELSSGSECFVTRLWPTGKYAEVVLQHQRVDNRIRFRARVKIEARMFLGWAYRAAFFTRLQDAIETENLPCFCVVIPRDYFRDNFEEVRQRFTVREGEKIAGGQWGRLETQAGDDREYFVWKWSHKPFIEKRPGVDKVTSLQDLGRAFKALDLRGDRLFRIDAPDLTVSYKMRIVGGKNIEACWTDLPGACLPWFLLCQDREGMKWDDLLLAKDIIAPRQPLSFYLLKKLASLGLLTQRGQRWVINKSCGEMVPVGRDKFELRYSGNPSILWELYRGMSSFAELPVINVVDKRGWFPYLSMTWGLHYRTHIEQFLRRQGVEMGGDLWTH